MIKSPDEKDKQVSDSAIKIFTLAGPEASFSLYRLFGPKMKKEESPTSELNENKNNLGLKK